MGMDRKIERNKWPIQRVLMYTAIPLAVAMLAFMMYRTAGTSRLKVNKERLQIATVSQGPFQEFIAINGEVLPIKTIVVDAGEGGKVEELYLEGGEMVKKGDNILRLSNSSLELNYMNLETQLLEQMNNLRNTRITMEENGLNLKDQLLQTEYQITNLGQQFHRNKELYEDSVIAEADYLDIKNNYGYNVRRKILVKERIRRDSLLRTQQIGQVESSLDLVARNLKAIQRNLDKLTVRAPITGQLSSVRVEVGESVAPGQTLGQVDVLDGFKVRARIDEHYISRIVRGLKGHFTFSGSPYQLKIFKVFPEVTNGTFEVDMEFVGDVPEGIKRGQTLQIRLALSDETQAILLAKGGFYQSTGGNWVYLINGDGTAARKQNIRIGRQSDRNYEVLEGLTVGDEVVISNYEVYNDVDQLILQEN